jgi:hypothetical protein
VRAEAPPGTSTESAVTTAINRALRRNIGPLYHAKSPSAGAARPRGLLRPCDAPRRAAARSAAPGTPRQASHAMHRAARRALGRRATGGGEPIASSTRHPRTARCKTRARVRGASLTSGPAQGLAASLRA